MKTYGGMDVWSHIFLTSALIGCEWSASRPGRFTPGERSPRTHWIWGWVDPWSGLDAGWLPNDYMALCLRSVNMFNYKKERKKLSTLYRFITCVNTSIGLFEFWKNQIQIFQGNLMLVAPHAMHGKWFQTKIGNKREISNDSWNETRSRNY
jgi:hypothetical protein